MHHAKENSADTGKPVIRHSTLPKLAACPKYLPKPGPVGPAAERGTRMDAAIRRALEGDRSLLEGLTPEDKGPAEWAVALLQSYKMTGELETREEYLAMHTPGISHVGTADVLNRKLQWVADIKTGQLRDYYHQLAAYALACMERTFAQDWTGHVVYTDHKKVVSYIFEYAEAKRAIETVLAEVRDPNSQPRACDYCDWCARKDTCPAVVKPVEDGLAVVASPKQSLAEIRDRLLADPEKLAAFAVAWKAAEKEIGEPAIDRLKELLEAGEQVPGWKLSKTAPSEYYDADGILYVAKEASAPLEGLIEAMGGKMGSAKFAAWAGSLGVAPLTSHIRTGKPTTRLLQDRSKKQKALAN
jgi:RNA polymerase subunit RPABC4/transcription elongation factor Spt4